MLDTSEFLQQRAIARARVEPGSRQWIGRQRQPTRLFPQGHDDRRRRAICCAATGRCGEQAFAVIGTTNHAEVGVELALAMARARPRYGRARIPGGRSCS